MAEQLNLTERDKQVIQAFLEGYVGDEDSYGDDQDHINWVHWVAEDMSEYLKNSSFVPFPPEWKFEEPGTIS